MDEYSLLFNGQQFDLKKKLGPSSPTDDLALLNVMCPFEHFEKVAYLLKQADDLLGLNLFCQLVTLESPLERLNVGNSTLATETSEVPKVIPTNEEELEIFSKMIREQESIDTPSLLSTSCSPLPQKLLNHGFSDTKILSFNEEMTELDELLKTSASKLGYDFAEEYHSVGGVCTYKVKLNGKEFSCCTDERHEFAKEKAYFVALYKINRAVALAWDSKYKLDVK